MSNFYSQLADMSQDLLDVAAAALTPDPTDTTDPRNGSPERAYVCHGIPVADGEQLTVHINLGKSIGIPNRSGMALPPTQNSRVIPVITFQVQLLRAQVVPNNIDRMPTQEELNNEASSLLVDGFALHMGIVNAWFQNELFPSQGKKFEVQSANWVPGLVPVNTLGGYGGWNFTFDVQL